MSYHVVNLTEANDGDTTTTEAFDSRLEEALRGSERNVAVRLHPSLPGGPDLVDWLANLTKIFSKAGKTLVVLPETPDQRESLDFSHPDQNIRCVTTEDELATMFPGPAAPASSPQQAPQQTMQPPPAAAPGILLTEETEDDAGPPVVVRPGMVSDVSGEYRCMGCGAKRMWLKGDLVLGCVSPECMRTNAGWQLVFDVF